MSDESSEKVLPPTVASTKRPYRITGNRTRVPPPVSQEAAREIEYRFWPKVSKRGEDECWPWCGSLTKGYGMIFAWGRPQYAHRIAYALQNGSVPLGADVLHRCDFTRCQNGKHLFLGDQDANMKDKKAKGRTNNPKGEACHFAKITAETALAIYNAKGDLREVATQFNVSRGHVSAIKLGLRWRQVTGGAPKPRYNNVRKAIASRATFTKG